VDYLLRSSEHGDVKFIAGELTHNPKGIVQASAQGGVRLRLEDGNLITIYVYQATPVRGLFQAQGAVPGV